MIIHVTDNIISIFCNLYFKYLYIKLYIHNPPFYLKVYILIMVI